MLQAVPSLPQGITAHINNLNERHVAAAVRQQALSSARRTCRCTCWFPGLRCQTQWNPDWAKLAPVQRKTWLTAPDTSAGVTGILRGVPALCCDDGKSRWLMMRRERIKEEEVEEEEREAQCNELLGTKNQSCAAPAIAQWVYNDLTYCRSHCLDLVCNAYGTWRFYMFKKNLCF